MIQDGKVIGRPLRLYVDTKASVEALSGLTEGMEAYASDTDEFGTYNGAAWSWISTTSGSVLKVQDEGVNVVTSPTIFNFTGAGVTATNPSPNVAQIDITGTSGSPGHIIRDESISLPQRQHLNFIGTVITATDNSITDTTDVTITGGLLSDVTPADVGSTGISGTSGSPSRSDHVHRGVTSLAKSSASSLFGNITLSEGSGIAITQGGQNISISSTGSAFLSSGSPADVGSMGVGGSSGSASRSDHIHRGVHSFNVSGQPALYGDVSLIEGTNVTLSQSGQNITVTVASSGSALKVQDEGIDVVTSPTVFNFTGTGVTATNPSPNVARIDITTSGSATQPSGRVLYTDANGAPITEPDFLYNQTTNRLDITSGSVVAGGIQLTFGPASGYVLTSDASGVGTWQTTGSSFANPSALVGLTEINGVATTAMRSDAAPALNQDIAPTWTGLHIWTGAVSDTGLGFDNVRIGLLAGTPRIFFEDASFTQWQIDNEAGVMRFSIPGVVKETLDSSGRLSLPEVGIGAGTVWGGDFQIYRHAADVGRTPDSFIVDTKLGIGTTTLTYAANVQGAAISSTFDGIMVRDSAAERWRFGYIDATAPTASIVPAQLYWATVQSAGGVILATRGTVVAGIGLYTCDGTNLNEVLRLSSGKNVGINTSTFGTSAVGVLGIANAGTVPSTSPANMIQIYSKDSSVGAANATLAIRTEQSVEAIGTFTASHKLRVWINETEYDIQLDAV